MHSDFLHREDQIDNFRNLLAIKDGGGTAKATIPEHLAAMQENRTHATTIDVLATVDYYDLNLFVYTPSCTPSGKSALTFTEFNPTGKHVALIAHTIGGTHYDILVRHEPAHPASTKSGPRSSLPKVQTVVSSDSSSSSGDNQQESSSAPAPAPAPPAPAPTGKVQQNASSTQAAAPAPKAVSSSGSPTGILAPGGAAAVQQQKTSSTQAAAPAPKALSSSGSPIGFVVPGGADGQFGENDNNDNGSIFSFQPSSKESLDGNSDLHQSDISVMANRGNLLHTFVRRSNRAKTEPDRISHPSLGNPSTTTQVNASAATTSEATVLDDQKAEANENETAQADGKVSASSTPSTAATPKTNGVSSTAASAVPGEVSVPAAAASSKSPVAEDETPQATSEVGASSTATVGASSAPSTVETPKTNGAVTEGETPVTSKVPKTTSPLDTTKTHVTVSPPGRSQEAPLAAATLARQELGATQEPPIILHLREHPGLNFVPISMMKPRPKVLNDLENTYPPVRLLPKETCDPMYQLPSESFVKRQRETMLHQKLGLNAICHELEIEAIRSVYTDAIKQIVFDSKEAPFDYEKFAFCCLVTLMLSHDGSPSGSVLLALHDLNEQELLSAVNMVASEEENITRILQKHNLRLWSVMAAFLKDASHYLLATPAHRGLVPRSLEDLKRIPHVSNSVANNMMNEVFSICCGGASISLEGMKMAVALGYVDNEEYGNDTGGIDPSLVAPRQIKNSLETWMSTKEIQEWDMLQARWTQICWNNMDLENANRIHAACGKFLPESSAKICRNLFEKTTTFLQAINAKKVVAHPIPVWKAAMRDLVQNGETSLGESMYLDALDTCADLRSSRNFEDIFDELLGLNTSGKRPSRDVRGAAAQTNKKRKT